MLEFSHNSQRKFGWLSNIEQFQSGKWARLCKFCGVFLYNKSTKITSMLSPLWVKHYRNYKLSHPYFTGFSTKYLLYLYKFFQLGSQTHYSYIVVIVIAYNRKLFLQFIYQHKKQHLINYGTNRIFLKWSISLHLVSRYNYLLNLRDTCILGFFIFFLVKFATTDVKLCKECKLWDFPIKFGTNMTVINVSWIFEFDRTCAGRVLL